MKIMQIIDAINDRAEVVSDLAILLIGAAACIGIPIAIFFAIIWAIKTVWFLV